MAQEAAPVAVIETGLSVVTEAELTGENPPVVNPAILKVRDMLRRSGRVVVDGQGIWQVDSNRCVLYTLTDIPLSNCS